MTAAPAGADCEFDLCPSPQQGGGVAASTRSVALAGSVRYDAAGERVEIRSALHLASSYR